MAINKLQKKWSGSILDLCAFSTGFIAVVFLLMLTREALAYYGTQEVLLGLVPAFCFGAMAYGIRAIKKYIEKDTISLLIVTYLASIPFLLLSVIITRLLPFFVGLPAGADLPAYWVLAGIILAALPLNIILGAQSTLLNHIYIGKNKKDYPAKVSQALKHELLGGLTGAVLYTLIGAYLLTSFNIIVVLTLMIWCCLAALVGVLIPAEDLQHRKFWGTIALLALFLFTLLLFSPVSGSLEKWTLKKAWRNTQLMRTTNTSHGKLSITLSEHELTVFNNRTRMFTTSENARTEENAHIPALALTYSPRNMLMVGGGLGGTLEELLKYASLETIDYCEFDRKVLSHSRDYLLQYNYFRDKRVQLRAQDGRSFLRKTKGQYDLILVKAAPLTALMTNRFATREFFSIAREKLSTAGIMVVTITDTRTGTRDIVPAGARTIVNGFKKEFPNAVFIPGIDMYCIGSAVSTDSFAYLEGNTFANRLIERGIHTGYFTPETSPSLFPADRISAAQTIFTSNGCNSDMHPSTFSSALYTWIVPFAPALPVIVHNAASALIYIIVLALLFIILLKTIKRSANDKTSVLYRMHGVTLGGLCTTIMFLFQALTGMAYIGVAILAAALLAGILFGYQRTENNFKDHQKVQGLLPAVMLIYLLGTSISLLTISGLLPMLSPWSYMLLMPLIMACAGYPLGRSVTVLMIGNADKTKSIEPSLIVSEYYREMLTGAATGITLTSLVIFPVLGFPGSLLLLCAGVLVTALISYS